MPTYRSAVPRSTGVALRRRKLQCLLIGTHGLVETTLRNPISARAMAPLIASEMFPAFCRLAMPSAYVRCAASRSPLVQDASPRSAAAAPRVRWSSSGDEVERLPGVCHGARPHRPAPGPCPARAHGDRTRETAKCLVVHDDHRSRWGVRSRTPVCRRVQPPFGVPQAGLNALELAATQ